MFDGDYLFPQNDMDGEKANSDSGKLHLQRIIDRGFNFRPDDCRHTFATSALESRADLLKTALIIGHKNLKLVMQLDYPSENHKANTLPSSDWNKRRGVKSKSRRNLKKAESSYIF